MFTPVLTQETIKGILKLNIEILSNAYLSRFAFFPENNYGQKLRASWDNWRKPAENLYQEGIMNGIDQQKQAPIKDMCVGGGGSHT